MGGVGVAFGVILTGVNIDFDSTGVYGGVNLSDITSFLDVVAQAAANFDIINNSWGASPFFQQSQSLIGGDFDDLVNQAYGVLSETGRGGLGTINVRSAGNSNLDANGEGLDSSRFTITVAATEPDGFAAWYSDFGANILVTAPAAAVTTDMSNDSPSPFESVDVGDWSAPSLADIDGDGDADLVVGESGGTLRTFVNTDGVYTEATGAANPFNGISPDSYSTPALGDLDDDGDLDLVVGSYGGTLYSYVNDGLGVFSQMAGASNPFSGVDVGMYSSVAFGDIFGTGNADVVVGAPNGQFRTFAYVSPGQYTELVGMANPFRGIDIGGDSTPSFGDFDGDGDMDMVSGTSIGTVQLFANEGGVFTEVGQWGYDPTAYTDAFNGTSASAPVVSGVIALMLDANAGLGWRDVQNILAVSARLTGSAFDAEVRAATEEGLWYVNAADTWNGGGNHVHTNYGYGMVNVYNAVRMAEVWTLFNAAQTSANEVTSSSGLNDFADIVLNDGSGPAEELTFTINDSLSIEHVALRLTFTTANVGNLRVVLTSAEGTQVVVAQENASLTQNVGTVSWVFGIDALRGELSDGTWTVSVADMFAGNTVSISDAALDVYGAAAPVDDVYHFTDEFLTMRSFDATRGTIEDNDGGIDWLNFAAVSGAIALDLTVGRIVEVAGAAWAMLASAFENAVTGDGNDTLTGTSEANSLHGMRGRDILDGGAGNDTMLGGAGNDTYVVDASGDRVFETTTPISGIDAGGSDTVRSAVSFNLDAYAGVRFVERLTLTGTGDINGVGNGLANRLTGNASNNVLNGGTGSDTMLGGAGNDTYVVDASGDRVFETTTPISGIDAGGSDTVRSAVSFNLDAYAGVRFVERLTLTGTGDINGVGNGLANRLTGNASNNVLNGGTGSDTMLGGAGNDTFVFNTALGASNIDRIADFIVVADTIHLENAIFTALTAGTLTAAAFVRNMSGDASDASDRIIYEYDTGNLYYDRDGTGAAARVHFATIATSLAVTSADFFVI